MNESSRLNESEMRKLAEAHLRAVNYSTSRIRGMVFFRKLVQDLSEALKVKYVLLGELITHDSKESIQTLAVWNGTTWVENFAYLLENTPCQNVIAQNPCFHSRNIQQEYPLDHMLERMGAESYIGTPLIGGEGESVGVLVALDIEPMDEQKRYLALSLLTVFATRSAAELQHRKRETELESRVLRRTIALKEANEKLLKNEEKLKYAAQHDELTGLANRALFLEHLSKTIERCQRNNSIISLLMIDLDGFKKVNDKYGHGVGDIVLVTIGQRLKNRLRSSDLVARLGGDEFVVLLEAVQDKNFVVFVAQSIIDSVIEPIIDNTYRLEVGCSIGISTAKGRNISAGVLMEEADTAMYEAKAAGKSTWRAAQSHSIPKHESDIMENNEIIGGTGMLQSIRKPSFPSILNEEESRKLSTASLLSLNSSTSRVLGDEFFKTLVKDLAETLQVYYIIAGKLIVESGQEKIETLAVWAGDEWLPNIIYDLNHTPCHDVTCQTMCFHESGIQDLYPKDQMLVDMEVESYIGMPMVDTHGKTVGTLVAMDKKSIDDSKRYIALSLLTMFATRGAAELQHGNRQSELEAALAQKTQELLEAQNKIKKLSPDG